MTSRRRAARAVVTLASTLAACAIATAALAQDSHYWTYGYGPVGQLTEGTIVGGVDDLSAVFYNPGAIALIEKPRLALTMTSIELASLKAPDAAGPQLDFSSTIFDTVPAMIAGRLARREGKADQFAFAFLARHNTDWDLGFSNADVPGGAASATAGFGRVRERVLDYWLGVAWSHRLSDTVSVGATSFFTYRAQRNRRSLTLEQYSSSAVQAAFVGREFEYNHVGVLGKLGLAWRPGRLELGATVTTPRARIWSDGKTVFNATVAGVADAPYLAASTQTGLTSTFHSPWSAAGGATWRGTRTAVHTTVEWFSAIDPYDILEPQSAAVAGSDETVPLTYVGAARSVVNYGAGLEHKVGDTTTLYAGVARNASPWREEAETLAAWDLTDASGGISFERWGARVAVGVGYAWGSHEIVRAIAPPDAPAPSSVEADFHRWTLSVGFALLGGREAPGRPRPRGPSRAGATTMAGADGGPRGSCRRPGSSGCSRPGRRSRPRGCATRRRPWRSRPGCP
jgi:hypothetical protein